MFAAGMITCGVRGDYIAASLQSVQEAGWNRITMSWDGPVPRRIYTSDRMKIYHVRAHYIPVPLGPKVNLKAAFDALMRTCDEPWLVVFEDDILVARGLRGWLENNLPGEGVVSLYTSTTHDGNDGWKKIALEPAWDDPQPWRNNLGACALAMPRDVAMKYIMHDPQRERTDRVGSSIGQFCHRYGIPFWVHNPSLVQHVGAISCIRNNSLTPERVAARFCKDVRELEQRNDHGGSAVMEKTVPHP